MLESVSDLLCTCALMLMSGVSIALGLVALGYFAGKVLDWMGW